MGDKWVLAFRSVILSIQCEVRFRVRFITERPTRSVIACDLKTTQLYIKNGIAQENIKERVSDVKGVLFYEEKHGKTSCFRVIEWLYTVSLSICDGVNDIFQQKIKI